MIPQQGTTPYHSTSPASPHLHIHGETCPLCDQEIPPEKLEEISGKIALRQNERDRAIRVTLDQQYATERAQLEAESNAALETLRQQSKAREDLAREEARKVAEAAANEKLAAAESAQQALTTTLQEQTDHAAAAKTAADKAHADLLAQLKIVQQDGASALAAAKTEAAARETQIRTDAIEAANKAVADKLSAQEAARQTAEVALHTKIAAAEERGQALTEQLTALAEAKESEVSQLKEAAAIEAARIKKEATDAAQATVVQQLADKDGAIAVEKAKVTEAEGKISLLTAQHDAALQQDLASQREVLEKAKDEAVSAVMAKAFEENQKLSNKIGDLQRQIDKKSNEELGEGAEIDLFESLKKEFPDDDIVRVAKGTAGADIIQVVTHNRKPCGMIVYDSKNHLQFRTEHVEKLHADQMAQKAEHAILSLRKFPQNKSQICTHNGGVLLCNPARIAAVATILRKHLILVHGLRMSASERESKMAALYDFMTSDRFTQHLGRVEAHAAELAKQQVLEKKQHDSMWKRTESWFG
jgi:hypothetical protein